MSLGRCYGRRGRNRSTFEIDTSDRRSHGIQNITILNIVGARPLANEALRLLDERLSSYRYTEQCRKSSMSGESIAKQGMSANGEAHPHVMTVGLKASMNSKCAN